MNLGSDASLPKNSDGGDVSWIFKTLTYFHVVITCIALLVGITFALIGICSPSDTVNIVVENCFKAYFEGISFLVGALFGKVDHYIALQLSR